jgi:hypothetical protein
VLPRFELAAAALTAVAATACTSSTGGSSGGDAASYEVRLEAVCRQTVADLGATPRPPDVPTATFGAAVAGILTAEAERLRALDPPTDVDGLHRDVVLNTDDQAAAWRDVATAAPEDLDALTERIASLSITRDDLAVELGVPACVRNEAWTGAGQSDN